MHNFLSSLFHLVRVSQTDAGLEECSGKQEPPSRHVRIRLTSGHNPFLLSNVTLHVSAQTGPHNLKIASKWRSEPIGFRSKRHSRVLDEPSRTFLPAKVLERSTCRRSVMKLR